MLSVCVIVMFGFVRPFVAEVLRVPSESMVPTLQPGDRVLVNKLAYLMAEPRSGDLVFFENPDVEGELVIKRVVGLPGDEISVRDGVVFVNGERRDESYVDYRLTDGSFYGPETVPKGHVFVMGDNRYNSLDSRYFGPIPEDELLGEVSRRLWPPDRVGKP